MDSLLFLGYLFCFPVVSLLLLLVAVRWGYLVKILLKYIYKYFASLAIVFLVIASIGGIYVYYRGIKYETTPIKIETYNQESNIQPVVSDNTFSDYAISNLKYLTKELSDEETLALYTSKSSEDPLRGVESNYRGGISNLLLSFKKLFGNSNLKLYLYNKEKNTYKEYSVSQYEMESNRRSLIKSLNEKYGTSQAENMYDFDIDKSMEVSYLKNGNVSVKSINKYSLKNKQEIEEYVNQIPKKED